MKLVFATNNAHKLEEVAAMLPEGYELLSLKDIRCDVDIPETADSLQGNALQRHAMSRNTSAWTALPMIQGLKSKR